jgi:NAD(P)-dependent dehydrogenase (short-subunit alcohol dehydrogenase family)
MQDFRGKVAVITGAASGIGYAMAERFADEGMKVVLADVEPGALERAVAGLRERGHDVLGVQTDVASAEAVEHLARQAFDRYGKVHVLCNNAGVSGGKGGHRAIIWEASLNDWQWITGVNYWGVAHGIRVFVPRMLEHGEEGHVVNTSSQAGLAPGMGVYGATKHAVVSMSESLYRDFRRVHARLGVTCLCPTVVATALPAASRNRPAELQDSPEQGVLTPQQQERVRALMATAMPPSAVADMVVDAMRNNLLYLITGVSDYENMIRDRCEAIVARRNPSDEWLFEGLT